MLVISVTLLHVKEVVGYFRVIKSRKNEMGAACSTHGGDKRCIKCFGGET
jgi:hypothetical protein